MQGLQLYSHLLDDSAIVVGDFNSNAVWNAQSRSANHDHVVRALAQRGLESAYHAHLRELHGKETHPTHYWQWKPEQPFHLDYCFVPATWCTEIRDVNVGGYEEWKLASDHRPVVVDLEGP
jgi:endonuclease/exonuclease/phosphatase family metal-dependent hydrolase